MGGFDGRTYLNCREAFLANYDKGYRCFEVDMLFSSDGALVCLHDDTEALFGLPKPFTRQQFVSTKLAGRYTGLTVEDLVELMREKTDWYLVTDIKDEVPRGLRVLLAAAQAKGINAAGRIIPQIYGESEETLISQLPFDRWILTIYRMGELWDTARDIVRRQPKIIVMTIPMAWLTDERVQIFRKEGVELFVHTVNEPAECNKLLERGIGLYTDTYIKL
jgi:glycerophosphoryl diester phosphodiesterase